MAQYVKDSDCKACFNYMAMENGRWNVVLAKFKKDDIPEIKAVYQACDRCYKVCEKENKKNWRGYEMDGCYQGVDKFRLLTKKRYEELL